jgi:hypothetical protein
MAERAEMTAIIDYVESLLNDASTFNREASIQLELDFTRVEFDGLALRPDRTEKIYTPDSIEWYEVGFMADTAVIHDNLDGTGAAITPDASDFLSPRFTFTASQNGQWYYLFGTGYNPFTVAADLSDRHPNPQVSSYLRSFRFEEYSESYDPKHTPAQRFRAKGLWLNTKRIDGSQVGYRSEAERRHEAIWGS